MGIEVTDERLFNAERDQLRARVAELEAALKSILDACDQGKMVQVVGITGQTIEAQVRASVYNRVPAWPVEEARAALGAGQ